MSISQATEEAQRLRCHSLTRRRACPAARQDSCSSRIPGFILRWFLHQLAERGVIPQSRQVWVGGGLVAAIAAGERLPQEGQRLLGSLPARDRVGRFLHRTGGDTGGGIKRGTGPGFALQAPVDILGGFLEVSLAGQQDRAETSRLDKAGRRFDGPAENSDGLFLLSTVGQEHALAVQRLGGVG